MGSTRYMMSILLAALLWTACGQDEVLLPDNGGASDSLCGGWYPGNEADAGATAGFGFAEDDTFPCLVWESVRLAGEDTYINLGEEFLKAAHGESARKALVLVVSAGGCPACAALIDAMKNRAAELEQAGALIIGVIWRDLNGIDIDYTLDKAEEMLVLGEEWPAESWPLTNDAEGHVRTRFQEGFPRIVVVRLADMSVRSTSQLAFSADEDGVDDLLEMIATFSP